ncbi:MAG: nitrilase-related carbon-nitrogen hydrolase [Gemmatimonadota bacterium]
MPKRSWVLLLAGFVLLPWTELQTTIALAAWVAPALLLRFSRTAQSGWRSWISIVVVYTVASLISLRNGLLPIPFGFLLLLAVATALVRSVPYTLDRWLNLRLRALSRSLVFPVCMTSMEWLAMRYSPYGSWGSTAYSQYYDLPLIQIVSITGIAGLTFLVHWIAPVLNALAEETPGTRHSRAPAVAFGTVLALALGYGGVRLALAGRDAHAVTVAAVVPSESEYDRTFAGADLTALAGADLNALAGASDSARLLAGTRFNANADRLFARTIEAAKLGARVIAWPEYVPVLDEDHPAMLKAARSVAQENHIYLLITPLVIMKASRFPYLQNLTVLVDPSGEVRWRYPKSYPVVGLETESYGRGAGHVFVAQTRVGRVSSAICQDLDFPWLIRKIGMQKASLLIGPSDDWRAIERTHAHMAVFRAIENGFSLLRPANNGISEAVDPYGRVRAMSASSEVGQTMMLAALPTQRVPTIYARLGDWFAWCCVAGMIWFIALMGPPLERRS